MPEFPHDWLGWLTLAGSLAGLLAAIRLFVANMWFNSFQRRVLIAVEQSTTKTLTIVRCFGGGIVFLVGPKSGNVANDYHKYLSEGGGANNDSHENLIYLTELAKRGYFVYSADMVQMLDSQMKDEVFTITAKGLRLAKVFKLLYSLILGT